MKILICDDEIQYVNTLQAHVQQYMDSRFINYEILAITSPKEILESETRFDLAFLDIPRQGAKAPESEDCPVFCYEL